jgi:hypothetical protein
VQEIYALKQNMAPTAPILCNYYPTALHRVTSFQILTKKGKILFTPLIQVWLFSTQIFTQLIIYEASHESVKYRILPNTFEKCGNLSRNFLPLELQRYLQSTDVRDSHFSLTTFDKELICRVS